MDYKYIEQLLERYWDCQTSLEEESILRAFFSQAELPAELEQYRPLFSYEAEERAEQLADDFDARVLAMVDEPQPVVARRVRLTQRLMPLFKAAAVVAIILTLGNAAQAPWDNNWNDPRIELANSRVQPTDTTLAAPVQAENIQLPQEQADSIRVMQ